MSRFQEDMIFKNVNEDDARIFLDILGKKSKKVKIMTTELRQLDPATFVPDIILELDDEILIIELQSTTGDIDGYVEYVVNTLLELNGLAPSIKALAYGIEWLIVDKFVNDEQTRNILCDRLGDRMSLIHEYGENKENKIVRNLLKSGMSAEVIAKRAEVPLSRVKAIERQLKSKK